MKLTDKKEILKMSLFFMLLYTISYVTRINYGAVISEIVKAEGMLKSDASLALTTSAITYGIGQLLSGFLGDKINPKKLIFFGLLLTISMNLLLPFCGSAYAMSAAWGVNGIAQAFMWPPLVKIMTSLFTSEDYTKACMYVSWGGSVGAILVYALAPVCILVGGWHSIFLVSAACAALMAIFWIKKCPNIKQTTKSNDNKYMQKSKISAKIYIVIACLMLIIILQGILRDGVSTWMPSYISETFKLDNKIAILTGVILPVFSILITKITETIYSHLIKCETFLAGTIFAIGAAASALLFLTNGKSPALSVFLAALLTGCMHGVNWIMTCMMPPKFGQYGKISFMSGLLNFCTYIGSATSMYGIALFSEKAGWNATLVLWTAVALLGTAICYILSIGKSHKSKIEF